MLTSDNNEIYDELRDEIKQYIDNDKIIDVFPSSADEKKKDGKTFRTKVGKYSYGPLCNHWLVETVGAFCSFERTVDVVVNHTIDCISVHPFMYSAFGIYELSQNAPWYFKGVMPKVNPHKLRRITVGNDVWLGKNVVITNGANIGNGVIAGAGAVITKDVPDYAVVVGVPARILRFRYTQEQIERLNKIAWWDWPDDKIRTYYNDFYDDVDTFIKKHGIVE